VQCRAKLETLPDVYASFCLVAEQQTAPSATGVVLAAQQFHKFLPFLPFQADRLALARVATGLPASHHQPRPTTRRTSLSGRLSVTYSPTTVYGLSFNQITQPSENHPRPEQSSLPSALILEPGVVTRRPTFHLPANRCTARRLSRLMEVPGCSTAALFRFAFGAPSLLSLRLEKRLGQTI